MHAQFRPQTEIVHVLGRHINKKFSHKFFTFSSLIMFLLRNIFSGNAAVNDPSKSTEFPQIGIRKNFKLYKNKDFDWRSNVLDPHSNGRSLTTWSPWPFDEWKVFTMAGRPGLCILYDLFSEEEQLQWLRQCLFDYPEPPNITNLSSNGTYSGSDVFKVCGAEKLRWTTLGHHYDWTSKEYSMEEVEALPTEIEHISQLVLDVLGLCTFWPDAAIINYYPRNASLSPHSDRSESDLTRPLVSLSLGQSAIFLIGGLTPDCPADALLLRSGDVLVMGGQERIAFHAVPRILSGETTFGDGKGTEAEEVVEYANRCRVNLTVRQVEIKREGGG